MANPTWDETTPLQPQSQPTAQGAPAAPAAPTWDSTVDLAEKYGSVGQQVLAGVEGLARGVTFGLSTGVERALGVPAEDILMRQEVNPVSALGGEALSYAIPGLGIAKGAKALGTVPRAIEKAGEGVARAVVGGTSPVAKVGSQAVNMAIQSALAQSSNEVHKMLAADPRQTAETALSDIGLATVLGGGIGGAFGVVNPLWKATQGSKFGNFLDDMTSKLNKEKVELPSDIAAAAKRLGVDDLITPEIQTGMGGSDWVKQQFHVLQESQTPAALKLKAKLGELRQKLGDISVLTKSELKSSVDDIRSSLKEATFSESLQAREALEMAKSEIRAKAFDDRFGGKQMIKKLNDDLDLSLKKINETADDEIVSSLGFSNESLGPLKNISKYNRGVNFRNEIVKDIDTRFGAHEEAYDEISKQFDLIPIKQEQDVIADRLAQLANEKRWDIDPQLESYKVVSRVYEALPNIKNLEDLRIYKSELSKDLRSKNLFDINKEINKAFDDVIDQTYLAQARKKGPNFLSKFQATQAAYAADRAILDDLADYAGVKNYKGAKTFLHSIKNDINPEDLVRKLSKTEDVNFIRFIDDKFPAISQQVRKYHLESLVGEAANRAKDGRRLDSKWLFDQIDGMTPEFKQWMFSSADDSVAKQVLIKAEKELAETAAAGSSKIGEAKLALEREKLSSKAESERILGGARTDFQESVKDLRNTAAADIKAAKSSAQDRINDIKTILDSVHHRSSFTPGNLDAQIGRAHV